MLIYINYRFEDPIMTRRHEALVCSLVHARIPHSFYYIRKGVNDVLCYSVDMVHFQTNNTTNFDSDEDGLEYTTSLEPGSNAHVPNAYVNPYQPRNKRTWLYHIVMT